METNSRKEEISRLYREDRLSTRQIATLLGIGQSTVLRLLADAPKRSMSEAGRLRFGYEPLKLRGTHADLAYLVGVYLGDGCLVQCPRTELLDIACDARQQGLIRRYFDLTERVFGKTPSLRADSRANCVHIRLYGTGISSILGFDLGPKREQDLHLPAWIKSDADSCRRCLRGLFETDGYLHYRRGREKSVVVGVSNTNQTLLDEIEEVLYNLGYAAFKRSETRIDCWKFDEAMRFVADIEFDKS